MSLRPFRSLSDDERRRAAESLRTVGGVYELIALIVEHDRSEPHRHCRHCGFEIARRSWGWAHARGGFATCLFPVTYDTNGRYNVATPEALESAHE